jgi:hypothetical protein
LRNDESTGLFHVATADESWFSYRYDPRKITRGSPTKEKGNNCNKRALVTIFFTGTKLLVLAVLPREEKFNQNHFLATITPELLKENSNFKRKVRKKELIMHMNNFVYHHGRKIREYFPRRNNENPHPVYSPDLLPCDFWFCGYAKEQLKDQSITDESDLENKLADIWEHVRRDVLQSVFLEWMERLEWVSSMRENVISINTI